MNRLVVGSGRVLPSRSSTGPTATELPADGGGTGAGVGAGLGGAGGVIVVPYAGGGGLLAEVPTRSARLGASSRRGTPSGGRPSRSSTVLPMDTWEFQRESMPALTGPPNISSGTRGP